MQYPSLKVHTHTKLLGTIGVGFDITGQLLTDQIFCICQITWGEWEYNETVHQVFTDFTQEGLWFS
jgi:hypothetical protein